MEINSINLDSDRSMKKLFMASAAAHIGLLVLILAAEKLNFISLSSLEKTNIRLANASVRVDIVAMPKYTIKELRAMTEQEEVAPSQEVEKPAEEVKEAPPEKDEYVVEKKKQDFMSMLKDLSQKKVDAPAPKKNAKSKDDQKVLSNGKRDSMGKAMRGRLNKLIIAGNQLGSGSAIVGNGNGEKQDALDRYASSLPDFVRPQWKLPSYLFNRELTCRLKLFIGQDGSLTKVEIFESSGDKEYDAKAMQAVRSSSPFPALPKEIQSYGSRGSIVLGFPL